MHGHVAFIHFFFAIIICIKRFRHYLPGHWKFMQFDAYERSDGKLQKHVLRQVVTHNITDDVIAFNPSRKKNSPWHDNFTLISQFQEILIDVLINGKFDLWLHEVEKVRESAARWRQQRKRNSGKVITITKYDGPVIQLLLLSRLCVYKVCIVNEFNVASWTQHMLLT